LGKIISYGKIRKIEIDDTMPCNKFDEFYLPRCDYLEELWPAILTKALIKLYSYKIVSSSFKECGDFEPLYALTGYVPEKINLNEKGLYRMFDEKKEEEEEKEGEEKEKENEENKENKENNKEKENNKNNNTNNNLNNNIVIEDEKEEESILLKKDLSKTSIISKTDENDGILFLENALTDENYKKENFYILCYRKTEEKEIDSGKELIHQKTFKKKRDFKRLSTYVQRKPVLSTKNLNEENLLNRYKRKTSLKSQKLAFEEISEEMESNKIRNQQKRTKSVAKNQYFKSTGNVRNNFDNSQISENKNVMKEELIKKAKEHLDNRVYTGLLYSIVELFYNKEFNMNRLLPIDFSDLRALMKNFNTTNVFKQLSRAEKREYIKKLKDIKTIQKEEKTKRIENLKLKGKKYYSIKIENSSVEEPTFITNHNDDEIQMTKKMFNE
jgi:hypothetical protein